MPTLVVIVVAMLLGDGHVGPGAPSVAMVETRRYSSFEECEAAMIRFGPKQEGVVVINGQDVFYTAVPHCVPLGLDT